MKQLIAIDGNSLMHRAYHALPPMTTRAGSPRLRAMSAIADAYCSSSPIIRSSVSSMSMRDTP